MSASAASPIPTAGRGAPRRLAASLLLAAAALLLFLLLPQRTLHGPDGNQFAVWVEQGQQSYARHVAYLHVCGLVHAALQPFGGNGYRALLVASALGAALGLLLLHRAFLRLLPGRAAPALLATLAVLATPAWLFYATCGEIPGVFAAGTGLAWWAFARWHAKPGTGRATALGIAVAVAATLHSFGHLLTPGFAAVALALGALPRRGRWQQAAALLLAHAGLAMLLAWLFGAGAGGQAQDAASHLEERWRTFAPLTVPAVLWREWLRPFLPWSLLSLLALLSRPARPWALALLLLLLLHLPFCVLLLGHHRIDENGAYLLPLLPAAVLATLQLLPRPAFAAAIALAAAAALWCTAPNWQPRLDPEFAAGVAELNRERPLALVVGSKDELDAVRTAAADVVLIELTSAMQVWLLAKAGGGTLESWFDQWATALQGQQRPLLLSASACRLFAEATGADVQQLWRQHLPQQYRLVPAQRRGFAGTWVLPRSAR